MLALGEKPAFRQGNQALFDYLDEAFVGKEPKEPVSARAVFREGEAARLLLESGDVKVEVCGDVCQRAQKQPATEESAARQLGKTGGTPFAMEELSVDLEGEDRPSLVRPDGGAEAAEIFRHVGLQISPGGAQVQTVPGGGGDAAQAVDQGRPGEETRGHTAA